MEFLDYVKDFAVWMSGAVIVVGIIEWAKKIFKTVSNKAWAFMLPVLAIIPAVFYAIKDDKNYLSIPWLAAGIWAVSQLGYALIVKKFEKKS